MLRDAGARSRVNKPKAGEINSPLHGGDPPFWRFGPSVGRQAFQFVSVGLRFDPANVISLDHAVHFVGLAREAAAAPVFGSFAFVVHRRIRFCEIEDGYWISHESRRPAASSETGLTDPASDSAMRRAISSSQAAATDSSCVLSRLSMSEPARPARSDTGRARAFFKRSAASRVIRSFYYEKVRWERGQNSNARSFCFPSTPAIFPGSANSCRNTPTARWIQPTPPILRVAEREHLRKIITIYRRDISLYRLRNRTSATLVP